MPEMRRKHGPQLSRRIDRYLAAMARTEGRRVARLQAAIAEDGGDFLRVPLGARGVAALVVRTVSRQAPTDAGWSARAASSTQQFE
jgi:hypothetical protein